MHKNDSSIYSKVFTLEELTIISDYAKRYDVLVLADETAQWYLYDDSQHIPIGEMTFEK